MLILGIDPGLQKAGWGIIYSEGSALKYIASGLIKTDPKAPMALRLAALHEGLSGTIKRHHPVCAAIEETFVNKNPASALKLGQARGVLMAVPALYGVDVAEYGANKIKKSVVGSGHATKDQMAMMVGTLLPAVTHKRQKENGGQITEDEIDALAAAITHAHYGSLNSRLLGAQI